MKNAQLLTRLRRLKDGLIWMFTHYTLGFVIVMTITVISCAFSTAYLSTLEKDLTRTFEFEIKGQDYSQQAYTQMLILENEVKDLFIFSEQGRKTQAMKEINQGISDLRDTMKAADSRFYTRAGHDILQQTLVSLDGYILSVQSLAKQILAAPETGAANLEKVRFRREILEKDLKRLIANKTANSFIGYSQLILQLRLSLLITIVILVITIVIRVLMYLSGRKKQRSQFQATKS